MNYTDTAGNPATGVVWSPGPREDVATARLYFDDLDNLHAEISQGRKVIDRIDFPSDVVRFHDFGCALPRHGWLIAGQLDETNRITVMRLDPARKDPR